MAEFMHVYASFEKWDYGSGRPTWRRVGPTFKIPKRLRKSPVLAVSIRRLTNQQARKANLSGSVTFY